MMKSLGPDSDGLESYFDFFLRLAFVATNNFASVFFI